MKHLFLLCLLACFVENEVHCASSKNLSTSEAIVFGTVQGLTEFLPISSTGHLILVDQIAQKKFAWREEQGRSDAKNSYFSIIQFGSIFAVLVLYRHRFKSILCGLAGKNKQGLKLGINLIISFVPAAITGVIVDGNLQAGMYRPIAVASALFIGALIMLLSEKIYRANTDSSITLEKLNYKQSLLIGCCQCLAFIPGMSRSMTTIVGGYACNLKKSDAAEYSFLLGLVTLSAATFFKFIKNFKVLFDFFSPEVFLIGIFVAFFVSFLAIKFAATFISTHGIPCFAWYRILLSIVIFLFFIV